jgi:hypothetical protein
VGIEKVKYLWIKTIDQKDFSINDKSIYQPVDAFFVLKRVKGIT